ncbi:DivIVA domain-containing protein [Streptomyces sp. NPDC001606]
MSTSSEFRGFDVVLRGYDRRQVDRYLKALAQGDSPEPLPAFRVVLRGYDRRQVDARIAELLRGGGASG